MKKTNAMRALENARIAYESKEYEYDQDDLSGVHAAQVLGLDPAMVFKTLVARGDRSGFVVFCIPVDKELDLKKAAQASGDKRVEMLHVKDLLAVTGYIRGGCSPVGMKKKYPTFIDKSAARCERISVSAGLRGCQMIVPVMPLAELCQATLCDLTRE